MPDLPPRIVRIGETVDLEPHETVAVLDDRLGVLWTINGGDGGVQGMRIGNTEPWDPPALGHQ